MILRDLPDRDLVRLTQEGDRSAFDVLVMRHQERIYNLALRFCGDPVDAEDIAQRAFINAYRKISGFQGDAAFSTWLYRITFTQSVSFHRERPRTPAVSLVRDDGTSEDPADTSDPAEPLEAEETQKKVQAALDKLEPEDREIVLLRDFQACSYEEIAQVLQTPPGTVRSRLHRARAALRERLKEFMGTAT